MQNHYSLEYSKYEIIRFLKINYGKFNSCDGFFSKMLLLLQVSMLSTIVLSQFFVYKSSFEFYYIKNAVSLNAICKSYKDSNESKKIHNS